MSAADPVVSILIVNWNVRDLLRDCLGSLARHGPAEIPFETHVVDNASDDGSVEMVRREFPGAHVVENGENVGFGRANNQALESCRGEFILLLNPDAALRAGAIEALTEAMRRDASIGVAGARLENPDGSFQRGCGGAFPTLSNVAAHFLRLDLFLPAGMRPASLFYFESEASSREMEWVSGAAMMIRRSALDDFIFDNRFFMYGEDMELCQRIAARGLKVRYVPSARVMHYMSASMERQTSDEVHASLVKGPRAFFQMGHGRAALFVFDLVMLVGYGARWLCFSVLGALRPGRGHSRRASACGRSAVAAARVMFGA